MRFRTGLVLVGLLVLLAGIVVFAVGFSASGGTLEERWVSDTARDNQVNHQPWASVPMETSSSLPSQRCLTATFRSQTRPVRWSGSHPRMARRCGETASRLRTVSHALTEPAIEDIDGDGTLEVVASTTENALTVFDAQTGREEFRVPLGSYGYGRPTVTDFRPAPGKELVTSDISGNVVVASANGTPLWRTSPDETFDGRVSVYEAPIVDDVDADGTPEVIVGSGAGTVVLSATGSVEWTGEHGANYITTGQADDDPAREVTMANGDSVRIVDGANQDQEWQSTLDENARLRAMTDADGDGTAELYLGLTNGTAMALNAEKDTTEWTTTVSTGDTPVLSSPILANVDGEGNPEVIAVSRDGTVAVLDAASGSELAAYERSVPIWTFATAADLSDDGSEEVLVRYGDGRVVALDHSS